MPRYVLGSYGVLVTDMIHVWGLGIQPNIINTRWNRETRCPPIDQEKSKIAPSSNCICNSFVRPQNLSFYLEKVVPDA